MKIIHYFNPLIGCLQLSKHKFLEWQFCFFKASRGFTNHYPLEFKFQFSRKVDHAGLQIILGLYKVFWFEISFYDHRHWNDDTNDWEKYNE